MSLMTKPERRLKRRRRVRAKIAGTATRPRISVFRSNKGLSAQAIDDLSGGTLAAVNWYEPSCGRSPRRSAPPARAVRWPSVSKLRGPPRRCSTAAATVITDMSSTSQRRCAKRASSS